MRKTAEVGPPSSQRRLAYALLCAFAGCLNPLPEEYPSDTASPGAAGGTTAADPVRESADPADTSLVEPNAIPDVPPVLPPGAIPLLPEEPADAGADAGPVDGGVPAVAE